MVVREDALDQSEFGFLVADQRWGLQLLSAGDVKNVRKTANAVAHSLAKLALQNRLSLDLTCSS